MIRKERGTAPPGVVISTITFYPEISGTSQVLTDLAVSLAREGFRVKVYTSQPHYYEKHEKLPGRETYNGVEIFRIPSTRFNKNFRTGRVLNWASFAFSAFWALLREKSRYPILLVSSPPVLPFVGWLIRCLKRRRFVFLVHDVYPDIGVKLGFFRENGPTAKLWKILNQKTYDSASRVIALSEDMAELIKAQIPEERRNGKIEVIHHWADEELFRSIPREENFFLKQNALPFDFLVQYSGNIGFNHDLESLVEAARALRDLSIGFLFIGEGGKKEKLQEMVKQYSLSNVRFFPFQPREMLPYSLSASDLSVVTLEKGLEGMAVPSKFYPILAAGRPVLAIMRENCDLAKFIRNYDCGIVIPQGEPKRLIGFLREAYGDRGKIRKMGENARHCLLMNFTRTKAVRRYQEILESV